MFLPLFFVTVHVGVWGRPPVCRLGGPPARSFHPAGARSRRLREPADQEVCPTPEQLLFFFPLAEFLKKE